MSEEKDTKKEHGETYGEASERLKAKATSEIDQIEAALRDAALGGIDPTLGPDGKPYDPFENHEDPNSQS